MAKEFPSTQCLKHCVVSINIFWQVRLVHHPIKEINHRCPTQITLVQHISKDLRCDINACRRQSSFNRRLPPELLKENTSEHVLWREEAIKNTGFCGAMGSAANQLCREERRRECVGVGEGGGSCRQRAEDREQCKEGALTHCVLLYTPQTTESTATSRTAFGHCWTHHWFVIERKALHLADCSTCNGDFTEEKPCLAHLSFFVLSATISKILPHCEKVCKQISSVKS
ncbi:hypothetical protein Taro_001389, partial [Colocasia esculenta]|nr:hypothetical protein [Colocasia esculenta]